MHRSQTPLNRVRDALLSIVVLWLMAAAGMASQPAQTTPAPYRPPGQDSSRDLGTWKWSVNPKLMMTLRLARRGERLTGVLIANDGPEKEIDNGRFDDGKISFTVTSQVGKGDATAEYAGVLAGNVINGGMRVYFGAKPKALPGYMPWQAKRFREQPR